MRFLGYDQPQHREKGRFPMGIKIIELRLCDYCEAEEEGKEVEATDTITINGKRALVCDKHGKPIRKMLDAFDAVAEPVPVTAGRRASKAQPAGLDGQVKAADVRAWALAENEKAGRQVYIIQGKSKIRQSVIDAYKAAHGIA